MLAACVGLLSVTGCEDGSTDPLSEDLQNLTVECAPASGPPAGAWVCPAPLTVACGDPISTLYVTQGTATTCSAPMLSATVPASTSGTHAVTVRRTDGSTACTASLTVSDSKPVLEPHSISLWPPNHKLHTIDVEDCVSVTDRCEPDLRAEFVWASSDEPLNDKGDGNTEADILFDDCGRVQVRAERQGPKDGRVYRLGVRVVDAAGQAAESECTVVIDHSGNGKPAVDSGTKYRVMLDGADDRPACDGAAPPATVTPASEETVTPESEETVSVI
jgi:hypothetical protein